MKYANFKFILALLLLSSAFIPSKKPKRMFLESGHHHFNYLIDFTKKRFCYTEIVSINKIFNKHSEGNFKVSEDTVFLKSDYDLMKVPISVEKSFDKNQKQNTLIFDFKNQILLKSSENVFVVINQSDTIMIKSDTILYPKRISDFYLFVYQVDDNSNIEELGHSFPKEIQDMEVPLPKREIRLKTDVFENKSNMNFFRVSISAEVDLWNYQTIEDTIILHEESCIWKSRMGQYKLKYTVADSVEFRYCN